MSIVVDSLHLTDEEQTQLLKAVESDIAGIDQAHGGDAADDEEMLRLAVARAHLLFLRDELIRAC